MTSIRTFASDRLALLFRVIAVTVTLYPALRKFFQYSYRVEQFESYGMPLPELAVPFTGVVELVAILLLAFGIAGRLGAASLVAGMLVAIVAAGPNPASALVLIASVGLCLLGTGPYSYWDPTFTELREQTLAHRGVVTIPQSIRSD